MKKSFLILHSIIKWLILFLIILFAILSFILESPSTVLGMAKSTLKEQGITYGEIEGGFLSGFTLKDVNYNDQVQVKEVSLKVDFEQLKNRVLYIDNLVLDEVEVDKDFLASFIDSNSTDENKTEGNTSLPFDRVVVNNADISLKNIAYQEYNIHSFKLQLNQLETDMKSKHEGDVTLWLDSNMAQADLNATFKNENYHLFATLEGERVFIEPFVAEHNLSLLSNPHLTLKADGNLQKLDYDLTVNRLDLKQNEYEVHSKSLHTFGNYSIEKKDVVNSIKTRLESNVGDLNLDAHTTLNLDDLNNTLLFDVDAVFKAKKYSIVSNLREQNITIQALPTLTLFAKGNMKDVEFKTTIKGLKAKQNELALNLKDLELKGIAKPLAGDVKATLLSHFDSSLAAGTIDAKTSLNYKDVNNTLTFDLKSDLNTHGTGLSQMLKDANVTVQGNSHIKLDAKGDMKNVVFSTYVKDFKGKQNDIDFHLKDLNVEGTAKPLAGDVNIVFMILFDSSVANGKIDGKSTLNYKDLNNTLKFETKAQLGIHSKYVNIFLKDSEVTLQGESTAKLEASGSMEELTVKLDASANVLKDKRSSKATLKTTDIKVNLKTHQIEGGLTIKSDDKDMGLDLTTSFSGDYTKPKKLKTKGSIDISNFNAFGLNLSSLGALKLNIDNSEAGTVVTINSEKIKLHAKTTDQDHYVFSLKTDKVYPSKLMELPSEFKNKFIKLDFKGDVTLSKEYFNLSGFIESTKPFKVMINAKNSAEGLDVNLHTKHLKLMVKGNIKEKNIEASVDIDSVTKVQEEFTLLYPFTVTPVNGPLSIKAKMKGEEVLATITSPKLKMEGFNVEKLDVDAHYNKELLTLNKLSFKTTGFEDDKLNKDFYLNKKGKIHLGEKRDVLIDMHPKILVKGTGTVENMQVEVSVESLPLGHPDYGSMIFSSQIMYSQIGKKKKIVGGLSLEKMKLFYEAKFLDAAHDSDVIVITKKDKKKKKENDNFLEDTYIDLAIYAPDAQYKTRDIDLEFTVDVQAKKAFGKNLGMLGKVREINGRVEQAPKLFTVVDSSIVFRGTKEINPLLDIRVEHELPDVLIMISIHGDANRPKLDFSSDPSMAKKDILSYLLLGISTANLAEGGGSLGREAQLFIMNQAARDLAYEVELDRVFIKDDGTGEGYAVQAGKKLNDDTMFIIENSKEGNSFILEYEVSKSIKVEVGQHQKTVPSQSIDIFFRKRFK